MGRTCKKYPKKTLNPVKWSTLNELGGPLACPISRSLTTSCVCLALRFLPSAGVTRLQRYYEPLRHLRAPGLSLTGVRLVIPDHALRLPVLRTLSLCTCCRPYPGAADRRRERSRRPDQNKPDSDDDPEHDPPGTARDNRPPGLERGDFQSQR